MRQDLYIALMTTLPECKLKQDIIEEQRGEEEADRRGEEVRLRFEAFKEKIYLNKVHQPEYYI